MNEPRTYKVNVANMEWLEASLDRLNKKAVKLGCKPATITVVGEVTETHRNKQTNFEFTKTFKILTIEGDTPKFDGWKLVACIERLESGENFVSCVPGETVPVEYRTTSALCEHCNADRRRKEVFVLAHDDGTYKQVGRQCISDFLGGRSPESFLAQAEWGFSIDQATCDAEDEGFDFGGGSGERGYNIDEFLKMTAAVIRKCGWVSKGAAALQGQEDGLRATASVVCWLLNPSYNSADVADKAKFIAKHDLQLEERDAKLATDALAWGIALTTEENDYLFNLGVGCRLGFVKAKTTGIVASLISAYQRHLDKEEELNITRIENAKKVRTHLGVVKERSGFAQVTVKSIRSFDSDFGVRTLIRFETAEGSILIWWASGDTKFEEGQTIDITGTVKKHDDYKGTPQTVLSRVVGGLPKVKKPRAKKEAA